MLLNQVTAVAAEGDLAELVGLRHKHFIFTLKAGAKFESHRGILLHDDLIGRPWGTQVFSHLGAPFFLLQPSLADLLLDLPRSSQILYPKDIGFILITLGLGPGSRLVEAGTGSGSLAVAAAFVVGPAGHVASYEIRDDMQNLARKNLERLGLASRVELKLRDIRLGFDETDADAGFLDVPNPWDYIRQIRAALKPGATFGAIVPTTNQVQDLLPALRRSGFAFLEVCEILLRYYKPEPARLRPVDRMVAHTGFLIFGRRVEPATDERGLELVRELGLDQTGGPSSSSTDLSGVTTGMRARWHEGREAELH
jgi:tRNA (adenine57-N1/adenine58-N1)-methyltransferase